MKVLFIGGTGIISSACVRLALARGIDLTLLNRGQSGSRPAPASARVIHADLRDKEATRRALGDERFDAVVNWIAFTPEHVQQDIDLFRDRTGQYVFISSASAYQTPPLNLPITESAPLRNPHWQYSRDKIACEDLLVGAYRSEGFPITIVRPSHTYDATLLPFDGGYAVLKRLLEGRPVIVHGDGTSLWTLTHNTDFAVGFVGLLGNPRAIGDVFQITSDESLSWNQIFDMVASAAGVEARKVHVPSDLIAAYNPEWGAGLLGDKSHSMVFDNSKLKRLVPDFHCVTPFARGAVEIVNWHRAHSQAQTVDATFEAAYERILSAYARALPT
ncbi:SDR family oxidoreductase [Niveibacterium sp. SC-1]|uniref:SDR family oxidoreductase n=1 Tax=Niveibacterium sp. SC-1 TaxID=3135646 RepID=UPI00311D91A2